MDFIIDTPSRLAALQEPFAQDDLEWRIGRAGKKTDGTIWAKALCYMTSRAAMDRLDMVMGGENWQSAYQSLGGSLSCGIGLYLDGQWIWKWDGAGALAAGAGLSEADAGKGDFSNAFKRAVVQWGVGRYLYYLSEEFVKIHENGSEYSTLPKDKGGDAFKWDPPELPAWALPGGDPKETPEGEHAARLLSLKRLYQQFPANFQVDIGGAFVPIKPWMQSVGSELLGSPTLTALVLRACEAAVEQKQTERIDRESTMQDWKVGLIEPAGRRVSQAQLARLWAISGEHHWPRPAVDGLLKDCYGLASSSEITANIYEQVCALLGAEEVRVYYEQFVDAQELPL